MAEVLFETQLLTDFYDRTLAGIPCYGNYIFLEFGSIYPEAGKQYKVHWDGNDYVCTAYQTTQEGIDLVCLGNEQLVTQGVMELVEPFLVFYYVGVNTVEVFCMTGGEHYFGIYGVPEIIVLKDMDGNDLFFEGVNAVKLKLKDGGTVTFTKGGGNSEPVAVDYENTEVATVGDNAYNSLNSIKSITLPKATSLGYQAFANCVNLEKADFPLVTSIDTWCFFGCAKLDTLILRSNTLVSLTDTYSGVLFWLFNGTPIGGGTGCIYVPYSLVETYKTADGWSNYANQFRAIEDYPEICG